MAKSSDLANAMKKYIDSDWSRIVERRDRLRELLRNESVDTRYRLLMNVRGGKYKTWTGVHKAVYEQAVSFNNLASIRYMLDGFSSNKKYNVLKIQNSDGSTPLHTAAYCGYSSIITYLMTDLTKQQKYDILKIQDQSGNTALYEAASNNRVEAYRAILASVPYHLMLQLLDIKNKYGESAADIKPELDDEFTHSMNQGMS